MRFADLHLHTSFSDGTFTPSELIQEAAGAGLSAISVVDHDNIDAISPAIEAGAGNNIEVVPGIEISAEFEGIEIHILGYFIDHNDGRLRDKLEELRKVRLERVYKISDKLKSIGIDLDPQKVFEIAEDGTVGRLHIARALVKQGAVSSTAEAFQKYVGDNCPAYVCGFRFSPFEAIKLIKQSKGIPVLAHPYVYRKDELIPQFVDLGLMGLEIYYPEHTQSMINFYLEMAKKYSLLITGGSDCHGRAKPEAKIGMVKLPYEYVEKLKEARNRING